MLYNLISLLLISSVFTIYEKNVFVSPESGHHHPPPCWTAFAPAPVIFLQYGAGVVPSLVDMATQLPYFSLMASQSCRCNVVWENCIPFLLQHSERWLESELGIRTRREIPGATIGSRGGWSRSRSQNWKKWRSGSEQMRITFSFGDFSDCGRWESSERKKDMCLFIYLFLNGCLCTFTYICMYVFTAYMHIYFFHLLFTSNYITE